MPLLWSEVVSLWPLTSKERICGTLLLQRWEHEIGMRMRDWFVSMELTRCYRIVCRDTSFQKSTDLYVHSTEGTEKRKKKGGDSSLGNNTPWKLLWERKSEMSRNHQKSREIFKDWFIYLTLHIYKSHDKYFCKWSSTGRRWISTELFSTESLGVRAPDYLGRSSQADALRNKNRLSSRIQFALL